MIGTDTGEQYENYIDQHIPGGALIVPAGEFKSADLGTSTPREENAPVTSLRASGGIIKGNLSDEPLLGSPSEAIHVEEKGFIPEPNIQVAQNFLPRKGEGGGDWPIGISKGDMGHPALQSAGNELIHRTNEYRRSLPHIQGFLRENKLSDKAWEDWLKKQPMSDLIDDRRDAIPELSMFGSVEGYKKDLEVNSELNYRQAKKDLDLNTQEKALYERHLENFRKGPVENVGGKSTLYATVVQFDDKYLRIPRVWDGEILSTDAAIARAKREGLDKFPSYDSLRKAEDRYHEMHSYMEKDLKY